MAEFDTIYDEGWEARISDAKKKDCPYTGKKKEVWMSGYEDAGVNFGRGYAESKSKAAKVTETLMFSGALKSFMTASNGIGKFNKDLEAELSTVIDLLQSGVEVGHKGSALRKISFARTTLSGYIATLQKLDKQLGDVEKGIKDSI